MPCIRSLNQSGAHTNRNDRDSWFCLPYAASPAMSYELVKQERRRAQSRLRQIRYLQKKRQYEEDLELFVQTTQSEIRTLQLDLREFLSAQPQFDPLGRVCSYDSSLDFVEAFRPLLSSYEDVEIVLNGARISSCGNIGKRSPMRMFIMLPMIFLMGKIDFENETILLAARTAFLVCQVTALLMGLYLKQLIERKHDNRKIFVPGVKSPFDQSPNYEDLTETTYEAHELAKANEFIKQTLIGAGISSFIHFKMGVNHVVMIQSVMMPINLWDNPLVQAYILGRRNGRIWNERLEGESAEDAAAAAGETNTTTTTTTTTTKTKTKTAKTTTTTKISPEEAIAEALAAGADADFEGLWKAVKGSVNAKTTEDQWTALMVACGSPVDTDEFIQKVVGAGADVLAVDGDGWTALHWSAFHGRPEAAEALLNNISFARREKLLAVKASDGRTAIEVAKGEENGDVVEILATFSKSGKGEATLRQRKTAGASTVEDVD
ncbi:hypothetical protein BBO99_00002249 [Phytophthora kernoviae]|uniref:Uncharacterized protein n=1 Tax=Phytophthora kernoviae TaxID=325452 RepID=A0A421GXH7_9STRA|nr:hypothetical protein BBI17_003304 [Phytophthora kernoviae]RLN83315.1 hypothetical protein BBO99_00002249 [Phytophthora kernoviae]